jgi:hypothetical protein
VTAALLPLLLVTAVADPAADEAPTSPSQEEPTAPARPATGPTTEPADGDALHWPLLLLKVGPGLPLFLNARAELFVLDGVSVEAGVSAPFLIPGTLTAGARWRPRFLCLGCDGPVQGRLGLGLEASVFYEGIVPFSPPETLLLLSPDALLVWRIWERLGVTVGGRMGVGPTFGFAPFDPGRIEPAVVFLVEAGVIVF